MEIKTSELSGAALDYAMATIDPLCDGVSWSKVEGSTLWGGFSEIGGHQTMCAYLSLSATLAEQRRCADRDAQRYSPTTDWGKVGPLIAEHCTALHQSEYGGWWARSGNNIGEHREPLVAVCRAIVASKIGETVTVPDELEG